MCRHFSIWGQNNIKREFVQPPDIEDQQIGFAYSLYVMHKQIHIFQNESVK